jgi:hypothetical protein
MRDPKPSGCGHGCDFSPMGVAAGGSGRVPRLWPWAGFCHTCPIAIPAHKGGQPGNLIVFHTLYSLGFLIVDYG